MKLKLEDAENAKKSGASAGSTGKKVITKVVFGSEMDRGRRRKDKPSETHDKSGQRIRYFPDDEKHSIKNMVHIFCTYVYSS